MIFYKWIFKNFISNDLFLVYENIIDLYILVLCLVILLNAVNSSSHCYIVSFRSLCVNKQAP